MNFYEKLLGLKLSKDLTHKQILDEIQKSRYSIINYTDKSIVPEGNYLSKTDEDSDYRNDLINRINELIDSMSMEQIYRFHEIIVALFGKKKY